MTKPPVGPLVLCLGLAAGAFDWDALSYGKGAFILAVVLTSLLFGWLCKEAAYR